VLKVAGGPDALGVTGLAPAGGETDRFMAGLRAGGRLDDGIARVDRELCAPISAVASLVRQSWNSPATAFALRLDPRDVASGARLRIEVDTALPAFYVDLYGSDGSVRHLLHPTPLARPRAEWTAALPAGPRLVVGIGAMAPLDLGTRPESERASEYLALLHSRLQNAAPPLAADLAMVTVRAIEPAVVKQPQRRLTPVRSDRCANIVSRAQLGETLSNAELTALRTECR
jgi:hypothetical protein